MGEREQPAQFELAVPPELESGVYANVLGVWHTVYEFTLDLRRRSRRRFATKPILHHPRSSPVASSRV